MFGSFYSLMLISFRSAILQPAIASNLEQLARVREQIDTISSQGADRLKRSNSF
jgi:hypothetical protein